MVGDCKWGLENFRLPCILLFHILDSTSALNTSYGKARGVCEAAHNSCLPLQRALQCLVKLRWFAEVDHVDVAICCAYDQKVLFHIQSVNSILALYSGHGLLLSQI